MTGQIPEIVANNPEARACYERVQSRLRARGEWYPEFAISLPFVASQCAFYLNIARQVRGMKDVEPTERAELEKQLQITRQQTRQVLVDWLMVPAERERISALNDEGLDTEIARLCEPFDPR